MKRVLITGGTGVLGRQLAPRLGRAGLTVRILSRSARRAELAPGLEWAQADIAAGAGLDAALAGVDAIVHAASSPFWRTARVDVGGTKHVLAAAERAGVQHIVFVSIVGIDRNPYPYYRHKLAAEAAVMAGAVPWSILRATHFYALLDTFFRPLARLPLAFVPADFMLQPVDESDVAAALCAAILAGPSGRLPDLGGPEILPVGALAGAWLAACGKRCRLIRLHVPGRAAHAFRNGYNTCPQGRRGQRTWAEWLRQAYGAAQSTPSGSSTLSRRVP